MISQIRNLPLAQQRQLIKLLNSVLRVNVDLDDLDDAEVRALLVRTLRDALDVPDKHDLSEYLRRRLVDVVQQQFALVEDTDMLTDMELAEVLVDFILESAELLDQDAGRRKDLETFLRTKSEDERRAWLIASDQFATLLRGEPFDRVASEQRARDVHAKEKPHQETAKTLVSDLDRTYWARYRARTLGAGPASADAGAAEQNAPARSAEWAGASAGAVAAASAATLAAPALALPLGAVAGALFMAGRRRRRNDRETGTEEPATETANSRRLRARRSKLVQAVVAIAAFMVVNTPTAGGPPAAQ